MAAFAIEAFLNHVGADVLPNWRAMERKTSPMKKVILLATEMQLDLGAADARPMSTLRSLFEFRNELAHGRTVTLAPGETIMDLSQDIDLQLREGAPLTNWEGRIRTPDFAVMVREDVDQVLRVLHAGLPEPKDRLYATGVHSSGAALVR